MVGCSEKDAEVAEESQVGLPNGKTEGFFKVNSNLPSTPVVSTRSGVWDEDGNISTDNPYLNDGLDTEWAVENVLLLIFDGGSESAATLTQTIDLGTWNKNKHDDTPNQITTRKDDYIAQLKSTPSGNLYALAVVNPNGVIAAGSADNKLTVKTTTGTKELTAPGLADIKAELAHSADVSTNDFIKIDGTKKYFFMTNAVLSNTIGGTTEPASTIALQTLAPVDKSFIYDTEAKAQEGHAATDIYVERAVAKVTLNTTAAGEKYLKTSGNLTAATGITIDASLEGWSLDNTNKTSYIIRQVPAVSTATFDDAYFSWSLVSYSPQAGVDKYRFVGGNPVDPSVALYRTYWAEDPNYNSEYSAANFSNIEASALTNKAVGDQNPLYCLENTFDVAHQTFQNTTRALLAVKLTSGTGDFYIMGADRKTLYAFADVQNKIKDYIMSQPAFIAWFNDDATDKGGKGTLSGNNLTITFDKAADAAGKLSVTSVTIPAANTDAGSDITIDTTDGSKNIEGHDLSGVISTLNTQLSNVERFVGGISYYSIRIKHFGDDLTPWNNGEYKSDTSHPEWAPAESTIATIYPDADDHRQIPNYLGRYSVVRNNWYDLQIVEILNVGSATIPELTTHPDDELEDLYIKARINILSWAKRPQSWDLK